MEEIKTFEDFAISEEVLHAISDMGFEEPTPIQLMAIPQILEGRDVIGQAQTGTGKTAAFGIPIIEKIDSDNSNVQAIVLSPTRELAIQTAEEISHLMKYKKGVSVVPIYGGQPIERQLRVLKGSVQVVIGTPGRVIDHLKRGTLCLDNVKMCVLDEADQMLDMGFREDIEEILDKTPMDRQTVLFSATMPKPILDITNRYQNDPKFVKITRKELTVPQIEQSYIEVRERDKLEALCRLLDINDPELALVFCNTKKTVDDLMSRMQARGYFVEALHGDMKQIQRDRVMARFRSEAIDVLIATDVAARGIDVDDVDIVFNYDVPQDVEYYVHRIGRTGRAGRTGKSITFVAPREIYKLREIQRYAKIKIAKTPLPTLDDVAEMKTQIFIDKVRDVISEGGLDPYIPVIEQLLETDSDVEITSVEVAAALVKMQIENSKSKSEEISEPIRAERFERKERVKSFDSSCKEPGMVRFKITLGKMQQIRPKDLVGAIAGECGIPGSVIGRIDLYEYCSLVDIPEEYADTVLDKMDDKTIRGNEFEISVVPDGDRQSEKYEGRSRDNSRGRRYSRYPRNDNKRDYKTGRDGYRRSSSSYDSRNGRSSYNNRRNLQERNYSDSYYE